MATDTLSLPTAGDLAIACGAISTSLDALHRVVHEVASVGNLIDEVDTAELAGRAAPRPTLEDIGRIYLFMRDAGSFAEQITDTIATLDRKLMMVDEVRLAILDADGGSHDYDEVA